MKLKMTVSMAGDRFSLSAGDETEVFDDADAKRLIEAGYAVPVAAPKVERATVAAPAKETRKKADKD